MKGKTFFLSIFLSFTKKGKDGRRGGNEKEIAAYHPFPLLIGALGRLPESAGRRKILRFFSLSLAILGPGKRQNTAVSKIRLFVFSLSAAGEYPHAEDGHIVFFCAVFQRNRVREDFVREVLRIFRGQRAQKIDHLGGRAVSVRNAVREEDEHVVGREVGGMDLRL